MPLWATWRAQVRRRPWVAAAAGALALITLLLAVNIGGVRERLSGSPSVAEPIKLAVLPFENLTGDPEQEYFSDGLTQEMITQLGRLHPQRLSVTARTSSMQYKNRVAAIDQIGRELGVDYVLEGSARREGSRVRIDITLIEVRNQTQLWADNFDRELAGILALQHDVARGVAGSLALTLLPAEQMRLGSARPVNPEAYEAYLKGLTYVERWTRADLDTALRYFEAALEKDPTYALAYLGIHQVWSTRQQVGASGPGEAASAMRTALAKAIELNALGLDETRPTAHYALARQATWTDWDWAAAELNFQRAIELNPNYAEARASYSHYLQIMKRPDEAMAQIQRAIELDPSNPSVQSLSGVALAMAGRYDEAIVQCRNALEDRTRFRICEHGTLRGAPLYRTVQGGPGSTTHARDTERRPGARRGFGCRVWRRRLSWRHAPRRGRPRGAVKQGKKRVGNRSFLPVRRRKRPRTRLAGTRLQNARPQSALYQRDARIRSAAPRPAFSGSAATDEASEVRRDATQEVVAISRVVAANTQSGSNWRCSAPPDCLHRVRRSHR